MFADVKLLMPWRGKPAGARVTVALNTAIELTDSGIASWC